ncbi:uncharacterized protein VTP21DRAFT_4279 [Calcarisporiella thermophila]
MYRLAHKHLVSHEASSSAYMMNFSQETMQTVKVLLALYAYFAHIR